jgi:hypothetical protein
MWQPVIGQKAGVMMWQPVISRKAETSGESRKWLAIYSGADASTSNQAGGSGLEGRCRSLVIKPLYSMLCCLAVGLCADLLWDLVLAGCLDSDTGSCLGLWHWKLPWTGSWLGLQHWKLTWILTLEADLDSNTGNCFGLLSWLLPADTAYWIHNTGHHLADFPGLQLMYCTWVE